MPVSDFALSGVGVVAGGRAILHPLDLHLTGSGVCGLIGHNGSGKTTVLRVLAGQLPVTTGSVSFAGRSLSEWSRRTFARQVAYMPQNPSLPAGLLVHELVAMGRFPWHGTLGRVTAADRAAICRAMALTGVAPLGGRALGGLSGGERQRAVIAMCVAQAGRYLLMDEPTSALDVRHQIQVLEVVQELNRVHGIGIVLVLHDINLAARYCDELVAMHGGRVIARGAPSALMNAPELERIFGARLGLLPHPGGHAPIAYLP